MKILFAIKNLSCYIGVFLIVTISNCQKKATATIAVVPSVVNNFAGPTYPDNYTSFEDYGYRDQWNLANVHDPTVEKCGEYYYMYSTDASYGNVLDVHGHFPYRRSKDLVNWSFLGTAFSEIPAWVKDSMNNKRARMNPALPPIDNPNFGCWAPYVKKVGNIYRMYYAIVITNPIVGTDNNLSWKERAFIGLAESNDLATNIWTDKGMVVCSEPDSVNTYYRTGANDWNAYYKFNAIDPTFIITPEGEHWLIYGSWHTGIAALKLNPVTGKPDKLETIADYGVRIAGRGNVTADRWQALEAPEIIYNPLTGYYYLFVAYDGLSVAYNTRVSRSKNITGPYIGIDNAIVTNGAECWPMVTHPYSFNNSPGWVGISHCSVFQNPDTKQWFYASQARFPKNVPGINASNAIMLGNVRAIDWTDDGWPVVQPERYGGVPKTILTNQSIVGNWEQITLNYQYQTMQLSKMITLTADKKITGAMSGGWSFDNATNKLNINGTIFKVSDAWDWEAFPRTVTLSYAGLTPAGISIWGKKVP